MSLERGFHGLILVMNDNAITGFITNTINSVCKNRSTLIQPQHGLRAIKGGKNKLQNDSSRVNSYRSMVRATKLKYQ